MIAAASLVDIVLAVLLVEVVALAWARRWLPDLPRVRDLLPNLAAGLFLVLALRFALHGGETNPIALCLALAGVSHLADLFRRARR